MVFVYYNPIGLVDCIAMVMHFLHDRQERETLPCVEEPMTTVDFITALFSESDEQMHARPKHPEAGLWSSEVVTFGLLHALKGVGNRACSPWLTRDSRALFPPVTCTALALSPLQDPSGLDAGLLGRPDGAGRH